MTNLKNLTILAGLLMAAIGMVSCNFTHEEKQQMVKSKNGKDFFRDSEKWGQVIERDLQLADFTGIVMDGNADIKLKQGDDFVVEVTGNEKAIEQHSIRVENGVLHVAAAQKASSVLPSIKVEVTMPELTLLTLNGEGELDIKDEVFYSGPLSIEINGDGDVELASPIGCGDLSIIINGNGDVKAKKFICDNALIQMNGEGDITTDLKAGNIDLQISGDGEANLDVKCNNLTVCVGGNGEAKLKGRCKNLTKQTFGKASFDSRRLHVSGDIVIK